MSSAVATLRHVPHETLGTLANAFERAGVSFRYVDVYRHAPRELEIRELAGLVVLGGPMNVEGAKRRGGPMNRVNTNGCRKRACRPATGYQYPA